VSFFSIVSLNGKKPLPLYPTAENDLFRCIPQQRKTFSIVSHNGKNSSVVSHKGKKPLPLFPTTAKKTLKLK
jgi:hypothetical protein